MELSRRIDCGVGPSAPNFRGSAAMGNVVPEIVSSVSRCVLRHVHLMLSASPSSRQMIRGADGADRARSTHCASAIEDDGRLLTIQFDER